MKTISLFILLTASVSFAKSIAPTYRETCRLDKADRYDLGWAYANHAPGRYRGQCVDTHRKRPVVLLKENPQEIVFANFFDGHRFYTAHIPSGSIQQIYFQSVTFGDFLGIHAAHTQLRFMLDPHRPAILTSQSGAPAEMRSVSDITVSAEYMAPRGVPYSPVVGLGEDFLNTYLVLSTRTQAYQQITLSRHVVEQTELQIPDFRRDDVLRAAIHLSATKGITDIYNTLSLNCTTELFRILYVGLKFPVPAVTWKPDNLTDPVAGSSIRKLWKMGLADPTCTRPTLNEELGL